MDFKNVSWKLYYSQKWRVKLGSFSAIPPYLYPPLFLPATILPVIVKRTKVFEKKKGKKIPSIHLISCPSFTIFYMNLFACTICYRNRNHLKNHPLVFWRFHHVKSEFYDWIIWWNFQLWALFLTRSRTIISRNQSPNGY